MNYYDLSNIQELILPESPLSTLARDYWVPLIRDGVGLALRQAEGHCELAVIHDKIIPIFINEDSESCSIVSPTCYFYLSGAAAYENHENRLLRLFFKCIKLMRLLPRALHFDKTIQVNQWLLPTNPLLNLTHEELNTLVAFLKIKHPDRAIIIKGLTQEYTQGTLQAALSIGARLVRMRWLYLWSKDRTGKRQMSKLRAKSQPFEQTQDRFDAPRFLALYTQLYRDKHSPYSPEYTPYFFTKLIESDFYHAFVIKAESQIEAFYFVADKGPFLELGIIGYDTDLPKTQALYPSLIDSVTRLSEQEKKSLSLGAGSGEFKRQRGGYPINEYDAVFIDHLSFARQWLWICFSKSTQSPLMEQFLRRA